MNEAKANEVGTWVLLGALLVAAVLVYDRRVLALVRRELLPEISEAIKTLRTGA